MRPRHLYHASFAWLVLTGGRFTAPFLETIAGLTDAQIGLALAVQAGLLALLCSFGGLAADQLEARLPNFGRCLVLAGGFGLSTAAFLFHGAVGIVSPYGPGDRRGEKIFAAHLALRCVYASGLAAVLPVLDGITLDFLEREGSGREEYGRERLYGAIGWALASVLIGPLIDKFGFEVIFWTAPLSFLYCLITILAFAKQSGYATKPAVNDESTALREAANPSTRHIYGDPNSEDNDSPPRKRKRTLWSLLVMLCGSAYGLAFIFSSITLGMGMSVVENLVFLFFQNDLGGSNATCGLTVVVTVLFEIPIFQVAPKLLDRFGPSGLQQLACLAYVARVVGYTLVPPSRVLLVLLLEPLHGVTYACSKTAQVEFVARRSHAGYEASSQGIMATLLGVGSVIGISVGGWAEDVVGPKTMYRSLAGVVGFGLLVLTFLGRFRTEQPYIAFRHESSFMEIRAECDKAPESALASQSLIAGHSTF